MNLYLLLALAFGAFTPASQAPAARPVAGVVVRAECGSPARIRRASRPAAKTVGPEARPPRPRRPHTTPARPRAPATIG